MKERTKCLLEPIKEMVDILQYDIDDLLRPRLLIRQNIKNVGGDFLAASTMFCNLTEKPMNCLLLTFVTHNFYICLKPSYFTQNKRYNNNNNNKEIEGVKKCK